QPSIARRRRRSVMRVQLQVVAGPDQGMIIPLTEGKPLQLGRGQQPDVALNDLYVSRLHCRVQLRGGQLVVTDLGSAGGTYIASEPVTERVLRMGELLQMGETQLKLRLGAPTLDQATIAPPMAEAIEELEPLPEAEPVPEALPAAPPPAAPDLKRTFVVDPSAPPPAALPPAAVPPAAVPPAAVPLTPTAGRTFVVEPPPPERRSGLAPAAAAGAPSPRKTTSIKLLPSERLTELTGETLA